MAGRVSCSNGRKGGGPGTGETHVATALGIQAIEHHRKRLFSKVELVTAPEPEKTQDKARKIAEALMKTGLVVLSSHACKHAVPGNG